MKRPQSSKNVFKAFCNYRAKSAELGKKFSMRCENILLIFIIIFRIK